MACFMFFLFYNIEKYEKTAKWPFYNITIFYNIDVRTPKLFFGQVCGHLATVEQIFSD